MQIDALSDKDCRGNCCDAMPLFIDEVAGVRFQHQADAFSGRQLQLPRGTWCDVHDELDAAINADHNDVPATL